MLLPRILLAGAGGYESQFGHASDWACDVRREEAVFMPECGWLLPR